MRSYGQQLSTWGGRADCVHAFEDAPAVRAQTGGTGPASVKQGTHKGNSGVGFIATTATCSRCGCWRGELGSEESPAAFVAHLVQVMGECWRVLRDDGVAFVNMGDSYGGSAHGSTAGPNSIKAKHEPLRRQGFGNVTTPGRPKSLLLVPERLAIALSDDGWIIRQVLIWAKNNPMPESVRDRWTTAHEYVLMLAKQPRYFFDQAGIAEPATSIDRLQPEPGQKTAFNGREVAEHFQAKGSGGNPYAPGATGFGASPAGRNGRSVWNLNGEPSKVQHFAQFPREIPRRCILAATSEYGACAACGAAYKRETERTAVPLQATYNGAQVNNSAAAPPGSATRWSGGTGKPSRVDVQHLGWTPTCRCGPSAGVRPCVVLDPFSGSGTSVYVAASLGRIGVGVELSAEYIAQAQAGRLAQGFLPLAPPAPTPLPTLFDEVAG